MGDLLPGTVEAITSFVSKNAHMPPTLQEVGTALSGGFGAGMARFSTTCGALRHMSREDVTKATQACIAAGHLALDSNMKLMIRPTKRPFVALVPNLQTKVVDDDGIDGSKFKRNRSDTSLPISIAPPPGREVFSAAGAAVARMQLGTPAPNRTASHVEVSSSDDDEVTWVEHPTSSVSTGASMATVPAPPQAAPQRSIVAAPFRPPRPASIPSVPDRTSGNDDSNAAAASPASGSEPALGPEQQKVYDLIMKEGRSLMVTGSAGCGKTVLLKRLIADLRTRFSSAGHMDALAVTATTGIAACALGGITLHSFAGIGQGLGDGHKLAADVQRKLSVAKRWKAVKVLLVDEVSMLDGDLLDKLELIARRVRHNERPFGGIQLVFAGDFLQLPPVDDASFNNAGASAMRFCFEAKCWPRIIEATVCLMKVYRQGGDPAFIDLLNWLRVGVVPPEAEKLLCGAGRTVAELERSGVMRPTRIFARNNEVDRINAEQLSKCSGDARDYAAQDAGSDENARSTLARNCPAPEKLRLKIGAQVMLLKNLDHERGLVNGARGVVTGFVPNAAATWPLELPTVSFERGTNEPPVVLNVETAEWTTEVGGATVASRAQIPLKLAYALSIHKSQGMGISLLDVDLGGVFEYGQAFVALSRAVSLDRVRVRNFSRACVRAHPRVLAFYQAAGGLPKGFDIESVAPIPAATVSEVRRPSAVPPRPHLTMAAAFVTGQRRFGTPPAVAGAAAAESTQFGNPNSTITRWTTSVIAPAAPSSVPRSSIPAHYHRQAQAAPVSPASTATALAAVNRAVLSSQLAAVKAHVEDLSGFADALDEGDEWT